MEQHSITLSEPIFVIDSREQKPWPFPNAVVKKLDAGDYSLVGFEDQIAIERKEISDLFGTAGRGRRRFERELVRLSTLRYAALVIEANLDQILIQPPIYSKMNPKALAASLMAWSVRFNLHVFFASNRATGFAVCRHLLEKFWKEIHAPATATA